MRMFLILSILLLSSCAQRITTIEEDKDRHLDEDVGYMLIAVDTDYWLQEMRIDGPYGKQLVLTLWDLFSGANYILIDVPAGEYSVSRIKFSGRKYIDLDEEYWTFQVDPNVISYVGDVFVRQGSWTSDYAKLELQNNASKALEFMEDKYPNILNSRQITYRGPGLDSFYEYVEALRSKKQGSE